MSGNSPIVPQRREIEIMRVLFERRLKDRAIALAESRVTGSGKMVDLAYEWSKLEPTERRERLSDIGPEEIARLRDFAELNPDLAKAVEELDRRGVLPHIEAAAIDVAAAAQATRSADAAAESSATSDARPAAEILLTAQREAAATSFAPREVQYGFEDSNLSPFNVDMPNLDLGLPTTDKFLEEETHRREEAAKATEEAMDRVRASLDRATQRAFDRGTSVGMVKMPEITRPTLPSVSLQQDSSDSQPATSVRTVVEAPSSLAKHLESQYVAIIGAGDVRPTVDQLVALANDRQIGFTEHTVALGKRKEAFGGLTNQFGQIKVKAGSIPKAIAGPNLVVIHGRLAPQLAKRIEEGFLDIPGTRASVRVHPDARVVVLES